MLLQSQSEEVLIATGSRLHVAASKEEKINTMDSSIRNKEDDNMVMQARKRRNNDDGREPPLIEAGDTADYNEDQKKEENEVKIRNEHEEINDIESEDLKYDSDRYEEENFDNAIDAFIAELEGEQSLAVLLDLGSNNDDVQIKFEHDNLLVGDQPENDLELSATADEEMQFDEVLARIAARAVTANLKERANDEHFDYEFDSENASENDGEERARGNAIDTNVAEECSQETETGPSSFCGIVDFFL